MRRRWPLNISRFTLLDRVKLARFFLNPRNRWTQDVVIASFEEKMAELVGCKFAVFTSSGSTANTLLAMFTKDTGDKSRSVAVLPAVTWQTSCSPWIREGFEPHFLDISRADLSMDLDQLEAYLRKNAAKVACVFITSLLGFSPDIEAIQVLARRFGITVMFDNCEALFSSYRQKNISSYFTSTTSTYFAHHLQSVEGGFIFTNDEKLYKYCLMARNHGMTKGLHTPTFPFSESSEHYFNPDVDGRFDFFCLGNNFRNTDINATIGLLDFKRANRYIQQRTDAYGQFMELLDTTAYHLPPKRDHCDDVPFALPIIRNNDWANKREALVNLCDGLGIESRPIVSGNMLRHAAYQNLTAQRFPIADIVHSGIYVGLGSDPSFDQIDELADGLNAL